MKSILNIPVIKVENPNDKGRWRRFLEPSVILKINDKYFGEGYELYENNYRYLITKDLGQCYRLHAQYLHENPHKKYINSHGYYTLSET